MYDGNSCISTFFGCKINHYLEFFYSFFYGSPLIKIKCLSVQHTTKLYIYKKKIEKESFTSMLDIRNFAYFMLNICI